MGESAGDRLKRVHERGPEPTYGVGTCLKNPKGHWIPLGATKCAYCYLSGDDVTFQWGQPIQANEDGSPLRQGEKVVGANSYQIKGAHYAKLKIQSWDYIAANGLGYFEGNVVKYVTRWRDKGGLDDLKKAKHYLEKLIEVEGQ